MYTGKPELNGQSDGFRDNHHPHYTEIPVHLIHVDYSWNSRSRSDVMSESDGATSVVDGVTVSAGVDMDGFARAIHSQGLDNPIAVREVVNGVSLAGAATACPYELVAGFRRFTAVMKLGKPAVLTRIYYDLDPIEARLLNLRENTNRSSLKGPDLAVAVGELHDQGIDNERIATCLGLHRGYTTRLIQICSLPKPVLRHWQLGNQSPLAELPATQVWPQLNIVDMANIAQQAMLKRETNAAATKRYVDAVKVAAGGRVKGKKPGPKTSRDRARIEVEQLARWASHLCQLGVLQSGSLDWSKVIGSKVQGAVIDARSSDPDDIDSLVKLAQKVYSGSKLL